MGKREDPRLMSQKELWDYLDELTAQGKEDTPEFEKAYAVFEEQE